jgi:hypothetical protein
MPDLSNLNCYPVTKSDSIPDNLLNQVKDKNWSNDNFRKYIPDFIADPDCILSLFLDGEGNTKGFIWADINRLTNYLFVHVLSLSSDYQKKHILETTEKLLFNISKDYNLKGIQFITTRPKAFEKLGAKKSKGFIMEKLIKEDLYAT